MQISIAGLDHRLSYSLAVSVASILSFYPFVN